LAFVAVSDKAKKAMERSDLPKYYFSIQQYEKYFEEMNGETPYTPAISLILALHKSVEDVVNKGIDNIIKEKYELRKFIEEKAKNLGFELLVKEEENSPNTDEVLKSKILQIINCKTIIRELKEKYDDIEQLIYVLKNQVNFMAFLYLFDRGKEISYDSYSVVYDWYLNLSQDYIRVKEYRYKCDD